MTFMESERGGASDQLAPPLFYWPCTPFGCPGAGTVALLSSLLSLILTSIPAYGERFRLDGLDVELSLPTVVARNKGFLWRPTLANLGGGELVMAINIQSDIYQPFNVMDLTRSTDGGQTWGRGWPVAQVGWVAGWAKDGEAFFLPYDAVYFLDPEHKDFTGSLIVLRAGSNEVVTEVGAVRVTGVPRPIHQMTYGQPYMYFWGNVITLTDGSLATTIFGGWAGDPPRHPKTTSPRLSLMMVRSTDGGREWAVEGLVARGEDVPHGAEGAAEASLAKLDNGDLLCVFRVGVPSSYHRSISRDQGRTWSHPTALPDGVGSVDPRLARLSNGVLALAGGRPGLYLWLCSDGRGEQWQSVDLQAHHNRTHPGKPIDAAGDPRTSSAYMDMLELEPNTIFLVYDRIPGGWKGVSLDSSEWNEIYAIRIQVSRLTPAQ